MSNKRPPRVTRPKQRRTGDGDADVLAASEPIRDGETYTVEQFLRRAGIGMRAFREMRAKGLKAVPLGKRLYVTGAEFLRFLDSQAVPTGVVEPIVSRSPLK